MLERSASAGPAAQVNTDYRLEVYVANRPVAFDVKMIRTIPNQELDLLLKPPSESANSFVSTVNFKLFPDGDYTRLAFTSQTTFYSLSDQIYEPVLTYAM